uniref:EF-hand domain-containing protein n=1 Tax=Mucochytrium quahogii TaxID=96639 RepID=A0A7S2SMQ5_9STRA|mmetsp:Transcript_8545/g.18763  ORF Transcript_8545/g.18763 Transcript_8545/m.18763 type:complete len:146 (+) Transcript_8545:82-519(+)
MKLTFLIVFLVVAWTLLDESDAWGRRRRWIRVRGRRIFKAICKPFCKIKCWQTCAWCTPVCGRACSKICGRKRSLIPADATMPCALKEWDTNKDGDIDLEEFSSMAYPAVEKEDLPLAFQATDTDGNKKISETELDKAEFLVGKC